MPGEITDITARGIDGPHDGRAIKPAPFTAIEVTGMQRTEQDRGWRVMAAVNGIRADGSLQSMHYFLNVEETDADLSVSLRGS